MNQPPQIIPSASVHKILSVGDIVIDPARMEVHANGELVTLSARAFRVLQYLAENTGRVIPKDELLAVCWPGVLVTEDSLTQAISEVRRALGRERHDLVRTVPRVGYILPSVGVQALRSADHPGAEAPAGNTVEAEPDEPRHPPAAGRRKALVTILLMALIIAGAGFGYWRHLRAETSSAVTPTVAITAFKDFPPNAELAYFASGTSDFVSAQLARSPFVRVIQIAGDAEDPVAAARAAGADYVLSGSVQKSDRKVRMIGHLVDTKTGLDAWSTSFDDENADPFAVQNELALAVLTSVTGDLGVIARRRYEEVFGRDTSDLNEYDWFVRGHYWFFRYEKEANQKAIDTFSEGLVHFPNSGLLRSKLGWSYYQRFYMGWSSSPEADLAESARLGTLVTAAPGGVPLAKAYAHWLLAGVVIDKDRDYVRGWDERRQALALLGRDIFARNTLADVARAYGDPDEIIRSLADIRPDDPGADWGYSSLAWAYFVKRDIEAARRIEATGIVMPPLFGPIFLAAAEVEAGNLDKAKALIADVRKRQPDLSLDAVLRVHGTRLESALQRERAALVAAGLR